MHIYACLKEDEDLDYLNSLTKKEIKEVSIKELEALDSKSLLICDIYLLDSLKEKIHRPCLLFVNSIHNLGNIEFNNLAQFQGYLLKEMPKELNKRFIEKSIKELNVGSSEELSSTLDRALMDSFKELKKVQKIHHQMVPFREDKYKGMKILSKFAAGMASGGEFFDSITKDREAILWLSHTKSYVTSSMLFSYFEKLSQMSSFEKENLESFLEEMIDELRSLDLIDRDHPDLLHLMIARIDLSTYQISGFNFGKAELIIQNVGGVYSNDLPVNENSFEDAFFERKIHRSEKLCIVSPGLQLNSHYIGRKKVLSILDLKNRDILDEVFFELKRKAKSDFLEYDSSMILLEVDENAIMSI